MVIVEVAPPSGVILADPIWMIGPPPAGIVPLIHFVVVAHPLVGDYHLRRGRRGHHESGRHHHECSECDFDFAHQSASMGCLRPSAAIGTRSETIWVSRGLMLSAKRLQRPSCIHLF